MDQRFNSAVKEAVERIKSLSKDQKWRSKFVICDVAQKYGFTEERGYPKNALAIEMAERSKAARKARKEWEEKRKTFKTFGRYNFTEAQLQRDMERCHRD